MQVSSTLVTAPAPVLTVAQGKLRAGLDWADGDSRDALMLNFIAAATAKVQHDTGILLGAQTLDLRFDSLPSDNAPLLLPWRPIQSITSFSSLDAAGIATPVDGASYILDGGSDAPVPARIVLTSSGIIWPDALRAFQPWALRVVGGFALAADIPPMLIHAVGLLTAHYATVGRDLVQVGTIVATTPLGYEDAIAPYQLVVVP